MTYTQIRDLLDQALPNTKIIEDIITVLKDDAPDGALSVPSEDGSSVPFDADSIEVVTKAFYDQRFCDGFGAFRAEVALGGAIDEGSGFISAKHCFATLYYDKEGSLITVDLHSELR